MLKAQKIAFAKSLLLIERDACAVTGSRTSFRSALSPSGKVFGKDLLPGKTRAVAKEATKTVRRKAAGRNVVMRKVAGVVGDR
jgi:hypothetical protein